MKKISLMIIAALMSLSLFSCDIEAERPNTGTISITLEEIPNDIKAVSIWGNMNNWKADNVNGSSVYIQEVKNGKVTFTLTGYVLAETLQFQLTPMPTKDTKLSDNWWQFAISGSSAYKNDKNNIVCKKLKNNMTLTLNSQFYTGWKANDWPCYGVNSNRWYDENWKACYLKK